MTTTLGTQMATLAALAEEINDQHAQAAAHMRSSLGHARRAGELLEQAKARLPHGAWAGWLAENFRGSDRTARAYAQIARRWDEVVAKSAEDTADLSLDGALRLLTEPKPARPADEARVRVEQIRAGLESLRGILEEAYRGEAHVALGYDSWATYVQAELIPGLLRFGGASGAPDSVTEMVVEHLTAMAEEITAPVAV